MNIHLLSVGIDAVQITLVLIIAARILQLAPKNSGAWLIALMALGIISNVLSSRQDYGPLIPDAYDADFGNFFPALNLLRNSTTGFFMFLCHRIFREDKPVPSILIGLFIVHLLLEEPLGWVIGDQWASPNMITFVFEAIPSAIQLVYVGVTLFWILNERDADLVKARRTARNFLVVIYMLQVVLSLGIERVAMGFELIHWRWHYPIHVALGSFGTMTSLFVLYVLMTTQSIVLISPAKSAKKDDESQEPDLAEADIARIRAALETDKVYRQAGITVRDLAELVALPEYRLRALIHQHMGFRNFNALLHHYRVEEIAHTLSDPAQNKLPVLTLALSAGYQSINPFNRAFLELKGMTPTEFRRVVQSKQANQVES